MFTKQTDENHETGRFFILNGLYFYQTMLDYTKLQNFKNFAFEQFLKLQPIETIVWISR